MHTGPSPSERLKLVSAVIVFFKCFKKFSQRFYIYGMDYDRNDRQFHFRQKKHHVGSINTSVDWSTLDIASGRHSLSVTPSSHATSSMLGFTERRHSVRRSHTQSQTDCDVALGRLRANVLLLITVAHSVIRAYKLRTIS